MKLLHSADWHLGAPTARGGEDLRRELDSIPGRIADLVRRHGCDLVLLSGDLFDGTPSREAVGSFKAALQAMEVPVCIAPGNHDFVTAASLWQTERFPENVHVFTSPTLESIVLQSLDCRVYGAGYDSMDCPPLLRDFRAGASEQYALGVLHGDPQVLNSPYCPITTEQVRESGLDYLALGHIHKAGSFRAGDTLCAWPGCPMGRGFDECGQKGVWLVTLDDGAEAQFLPLDGPQFHDLTVTVTGDPAAALTAALPPAATGDYFRVTLTGECTGLDADALKHTFSQYLHLEIIDRTTPPVDLWAAAGEDTLEGIFFHTLRAMLEEDSGQADRIRLAAKLSRQILNGQEVILP